MTENQKLADTIADRLRATLADAASKAIPPGTLPDGFAFDTQTKSKTTTSNNGKIKIEARVVIDVFPEEKKK